MLQDHELHKKAETKITGEELNPFEEGFCFHDYEAQSELSKKHFSRARQHGSRRAPLYTVFLYK